MSDAGEVDFVLPASSPASNTDFFMQIARELWRGASALLAERGQDPPQLRIVVAQDLVAAIAEESDRLGLPPDRRSGVERVGGELSGKCLASPDTEHATVVLPEWVSLNAEGEAVLWAANVVAHEMGHAMCARLKMSAIGATGEVWLPWDVAGMIAVIAAEEFRVDRLAMALVEVMLHPTDDAGNPVNVDVLALPGYAAGVDDALATVAPELEDTITSYRMGFVDLDTLWRSVAVASEGIAIYLAHAESYNQGNELLVATSQHPGAELLEPMWRPLLSYLRSAPAIPEQADWEADRAALWEIGVAGFMEVWRRLGLSARPHDDTFYLAVNEPPWERRAS